MEALQIMPIMAQNQSRFNLGEYAEEAAIIQDEPTVQPSVNFLEANTDAITMDELTNKCVVPTWANQELTIAHQDFISCVHDAACSFYAGERVNTPEIRVSHIVRGRTPQSLGKKASELLECEKTQFYQRLAEKGEALTKAVAELLNDADEAKVEEEKAAIRAIVEKLPYSNLSLEGWGQEDYMDRFNSPVWEELYKPCLACGTCTFVCPTCQCYDIKDYDTGHGVQRYRCWDSCMYSDFTMMAHGNNRNSQMQRFRQRFMHKLVYYPVNNNGMFSCVGCGRCVEKCPSSLNIVKVIKAFENQGGEK